jgi:hypothetical protein
MGFIILFALGKTFTFLSLCIIYIGVVSVDS